MLTLQVCWSCTKLGVEVWIKEHKVLEQHEFLVKSFLYAGCSKEELHKSLLALLGQDLGLCLPLPAHGETLVKGLAKCLPVAVTTAQFPHSAFAS